MKLSLSFILIPLVFSLSAIGQGAKPVSPTPTPAALPLSKYPDPADVAAAMRQGASFMRTRVSFAGGYAWTWTQDLSEVKAEGKPSLTLIGIQPPGTPTVGMAMLDAYRATGDRLLLQGAKEAAQALMWCQLASGGWGSEFDFDPRRSRSYHYRRDIDGGDTDPGKRRAHSTLDDNKTQSALLFLTELANTPACVEDPALRHSLDFAWNGVLTAQAPNGGWPQMFNGPADPEAPVLKANIPAEWSKVWPPSNFYPDYYTLNDNNLLDLMKVLLRTAQLEKEGGRYQEAAKRLGDFLLLAQHAEPQPAWSQQYNRRMEPAWARKFEPPAICSIESIGVMRALMEIWLETGDEKYVVTLPAAIAFLKKRKLPDGKWARFYELGTNRPVYCRAETYEFTYDDSDLPTHYGFKIDDGFGRKLDAVAADLEKGRDKLLAERAGPDSPEEWTSRARYYAPKVRDAIKSQKKDGRWLRDDKIDARTFVQNLNAMSGYVAAAKKGGQVFQKMRKEELKREQEAREKAAAEAAKAAKAIESNQEG